MRGKVVMRAESPLFGRITPAYAGKRPSAPQRIPHGGDHPRLCGEKHRKSDFDAHMAGSPPPMRGKVDLTKYEEIFQRITPAYAGKSVNYFNRQSTIEDHPRLCGEKAAPLRHSIMHKGSPPPMRGKADISAALDHAGGITPAYAGKRD